MTTRAELSELEALLLWVEQVCDHFGAYDREVKVPALRAAIREELDKARAAGFAACEVTHEDLL